MEPNDDGMNSPPTGEVPGTGTCAEGSDDGESVGGETVVDEIGEGGESTVRAEGLKLEGDE